MHTINFSKFLAKKEKKKNQDPIDINSKTDTNMPFVSLVVSPIDHFHFKLRQPLLTYLVIFFF